MAVGQLGGTFQKEKVKRVWPPEPTLLDKIREFRDAWLSFIALNTYLIFMIFHVDLFWMVMQERVSDCLSDDFFLQAIRMFSALRASTPLKGAYEPSAQLSWRRPSHMKLSFNSKGLRLPSDRSDRQASGQWAWDFTHFTYFMFVCVHCVCVCLTRFGILESEHLKRWFEDITILN